MRQLLVLIEIIAFVNAYYFNLISEGFNDVSQLSSNNWEIIARSSPLAGGETTVFQGLTNIFASYEGDPASYVAMNFNNLKSNYGTISTWLVSPVIDLSNGAEGYFYTRGADNSQFPDRLYLRYSNLGHLVFVGTTANSVGYFSNILVEVNPNLQNGVYPMSWTKYTFSIPAQGFGVSGRIAFHYHVTGAGQGGSNANFIGIDSFFAFSTPVAQTSGDPHFYGFKNQKYDVMGQSYEIYNIVSMNYLQINSRFIPYYKRAEQETPTGTMMGDLGIKFFDNRFQLHANMSVAIMNDNTQVSMDHDWELSFDGGVVLVNRVSKIGQYKLTIETPHLAITFIHKVYIVSGLEPQHHFDYQAKLYNATEDMHGLLGQTHEDKYFAEKQNAFRYLDGREDDYRIKSQDLFGDDFTFNKFSNY